MLITPEMVQAARERIQSRYLDALFAEVEDAPHYGTAIRNLLEQHPQLTVTEISKRLGCSTSCASIHSHRYWMSK